jgi:hypothetical protein
MSKGVNDKHIDGKGSYDVITRYRHWCGTIFFMIVGLGQQRNVAENRSILIASCALIYMIVFGHGLPLKVNKLI